MNINNVIRKAVFKSLINENQAFESLEQQLIKVEETFISFSQKKIEEADKEIESAFEEKNFASYKRGLESKSEAFDDLLKANQKKNEIIQKMKATIDQELSEAALRGDKIFADKKRDFFEVENIKSGQRFRIESQTSFIEVEKVSDEQNQFVLEHSNIQNLKMGDILVIQDFDIGSDAAIKVYRKINEKFEELSDFAISNVTDIVEDPS